MGIAIIIPINKYMNMRFPWGDAPNKFDNTIKNNHILIYKDCLFFDAYNEIMNTKLIIKLVIKFRSPPQLSKYPWAPSLSDIKKERDITIGFIIFRKNPIINELITSIINLVLLKLMNWIIGRNIMRRVEKWKKEAIIVIIIYL